MMIGARIAKRREELGWSQIELARLLEVAPARISDFERGAKTDCNLSTAKRLAQVLGVSIDYLAGTWDGKAEPTSLTTPGTPLAGPRRRGRPRKTAPVASASSEEALRVPLDASAHDESPKRLQGAHRSFS